MKKEYQGKNFAAKSLGVKELTVYDVETENHNFYGNEILLHNSNYICLEEIIEKLKLKFNDNKEFHLWCKKFIKEVINPLIEMAMSLYEKQYNQTFRIELELEKIISSAFIVGKKHYVLDIIDKEGEYFEEPKFKNTGIETKKRNTPVFVKDVLTEALKMILRNKDKEDILDFMREQRERYENLPIREIAISGTIKEYRKYAKDVDLSKDQLTLKKGTPARNKSAIVYNKILLDKGIKNLPFIDDNTNMNFIYVNKNNKYNVTQVGFIGEYPEIFKDIFKIDYELMWQKSCIGLLEKWFEVLDWGNVELDINSFDEYF